MITLVSPVGERDGEREEPEDLTYLKTGKRRVREALRSQVPRIKGNETPVFTLEGKGGRKEG